MVTLVLYQWFKKNLRVRHFSKLILGSFDNGPVNKSIHYVLAILLYLLRDHFKTNKCIKVDTVF